MPCIGIRKIEGSLKPFIYNPHVTYFYDNFKSIDNWDISGSYEITDGGLRIYGTTRVISKGNVLEGVDRFAIVVFVEQNSPGDFTLLGLADENGNPTVELKWHSAASELALYVLGNKVWAIGFYPGKPMIMHKIGNKLMVSPYTYDIVDLPSNISIKKVFFETSGADITLESIGVYESAGTEIKSIRPIWTKNGVMQADGYFHFVITRMYKSYEWGVPPIAMQPSVIATGDMVSFDQRKHVWLDDIPFSYTQYAFHDGNYTYVWVAVANEKEEKTGDFNIITLDSAFNVVNVSRVTVDNLPDGTKLFSIYFVNIHGKWYAVGSLSNGDVSLFDTEGPWSPSLTFSKTLFTLDAAYEVSAHLVADMFGEYVLLLYSDGWRLMNTSMDKVVAFGTFLAGVNPEVVLGKSKFLYTEPVEHAVW